MSLTYRSSTVDLRKLNKKSLQILIGYALSNLQKPPIPMPPPIGGGPPMPPIIGGGPPMPPIIGGGPPMPPENTTFEVK